MATENYRWGNTLWIQDRRMTIYIAAVVGFVLGIFTICILQSGRK